MYSEDEEEDLTPEELWESHDMYYSMMDAFLELADRKLADSDR